MSDAKAGVCFAWTSVRRKVLLFIPIFSWEDRRLVPRPPEVEDVAYMPVYVMSPLVAV